MLQRRASTEIILRYKILNDNTSVSQKNQDAFSCEAHDPSLTAPSRVGTDMPRRALLQKHVGTHHHQTPQCS